MASGWLEIESGGTTTRVELRRGLTRLGAEGADVALPSVTRGELHVWDDPPKAVFVGAGPPPVLRGSPVEESPLRDGDRIEWGGVAIGYREPARPAPPILEEIPLDPRPGAAPRAAGPAPAAELATGGAPDRAWSRVRAGMLVELGLAENKVARRWQEAVLRGEYDADACARDLLADAPVPPDDPRLVERSGRLLRDFLMASFASGVRGTSRRVRGAVKSGTAFVVAQVVVILVYTAILMTMMVLARLKWDWSFDSFFDGILGR